MSSYATAADLNIHGAPASAFGDATAADIQGALDAASTLADGYLRNKFTLPIVTPSVDLKMAVCQIAAWNLVRRRGFSPDDPTAEALRLGHQDAMRWLERVAAGTTTPALVDSSVAPGGAGGPFVLQPRPSGSTDADGFPVLTAGAPRSRGWV